MTDNEHSTGAEENIKCKEKRMCAGARYSGRKRTVTRWFVRIGADKLRTAMCLTFACSIGGGIISVLACGAGRSGNRRIPRARCTMCRTR